MEPWWKVYQFEYTNSSKVETTVNEDGVVTAISITSPGSGYLGEPANLPWNGLIKKLIKRNDHGDYAQTKSQERTEE